MKKEKERKAVEIETIDGKKVTERGEWKERE
jgi:hypothetical protein